VHAQRAMRAAAFDADEGAVANRRPLRVLATAVDAALRRQDKISN
jgi:hypothetical protein